MPGVNDDTTALVNCIAAAGSGKIVWLPAGTYKISQPINLPSNVTIQGAGMWYTTLVGDPTVYGNPATTYTYNSSNRRISFVGAGSNIHLSDFAIVGKLNYRNDSDYNDGLVGSYGTGSTISRLWVEHIKTGAWIWNSKGLVIDSCRFRDTIADGCNINYGMQSCIVTNCTCRGTGDDCFAFWPASAGTYTRSKRRYALHGTNPFSGQWRSHLWRAGNRIEDCLFLDITYGCGILISTTFPVGANIFSGTTVAQRCDLIRCGGYDPGYQWRGAVQLCLDTYSGGISGVNLNNLNITNSVSDGLSIIGGRHADQRGGGQREHSQLRHRCRRRNGLWASQGTVGSMIVSNSPLRRIPGRLLQILLYFRDEQCHERDGAGQSLRDFHSRWMARTIRVRKPSTGHRVQTTPSPPPRRRVEAREFNMPGVRGVMPGRFHIPSVRPSPPTIRQIFRRNII